MCMGKSETLPNWDAHPAHLPRLRWASATATAPLHGISWRTGGFHSNGGSPSHLVIIHFERWDLNKNHLFLGDMTMETSIWEFR